MLATRHLAGGRALLHSLTSGDAANVTPQNKTAGYVEGTSLAVKGCHGTHCSAIIISVVILLCIILLLIAWALLVCFKCVPSLAHNISILLNVHCFLGSGLHRAL